MSEEKIWPSFEEIQGFLMEWESQYPERGSLKVEGYSPQKRPVYSITLTDPASPPENKQHVVLSAVHTGGERSSAATLFAVMQWLLSQDPEAEETLRRQVVVCLPVVNPDCYDEGRLGRHRKRHSLLYNKWGPAGVTEPDNAPEAVTLQKVLDRFRPDLYADVHGVSMEFEGQLMMESSAASPSRTTSRPCQHQITRLMDQAALEQGFPSDEQEEDREVLLWGPSVESLGTKLWKGRDRWSPGLYAYGRYHTLHVLMEITWQQSGLARFQRLLHIGNEVWEGEYYPGYPNRIVGGCGPSSMYHTVAAYGSTAQDLRRSRAELWGKHCQISSAAIDPRQAGKTVTAFTLSSKARSQWLDGKETTEAFCAHLRRHPEADAQYIAAFMQDWPSGQNRPEPYFLIRSGSGDTEALEDEAPVQHGIAFRLRLPFVKARIKDLRLNGHPICESAEDGYLQWKARGFTIIQINIPPAVARTEDFFVITCEYDPGEIRSLWPGRPQNAPCARSERIGASEKHAKDKLKVSPQ